MSFIDQMVASAYGLQNFACNDDEVCIVGTKNFGNGLTISRQDNLSKENFDIINLIKSTEHFLNDNYSVKMVMDNSILDVDNAMLDKFKALLVSDEANTSSE